MDKVTIFNILGLLARDIRKSLVTLVLRTTLRTLQLRSTEECADV